MAEQWLTYQQAGDLFGISSEAIRRHATRYGWRRQKGNDGKALVLVTEREAGQVRTRPSERPPEQLSGRPPGQTPADVAAVADMLAEVRRRADAAEARAEASEDRTRELAGELAKLRERLGRAEGEATALRDAVAHERAQAARERQGREAAERELAEWTAGGPVRRALRAFLNRRERA